MMRYFSMVAFLVMSSQSVAQVGLSADELVKALKENIAAEGCEIPEQLTALIGLSAGQVVDAAKALGDLRYFGIARPNVDVPGVSYSFALCPVIPDQIQVFVEAAEASRCPTYLELLKSLGTFAAQYNALILEERKKRDLETCTT